MKKYNKQQQTSQQLHELWCHVHEYYPETYVLHESVVGLVSCPSDNNEKKITEDNIEEIHYWRKKSGKIKVGETFSHLKKILL